MREDVRPEDVALLTRVATQDGPPSVIYVTGALRDGHWLWLADGALYVADNLGDAARHLWPRAEFREPVGRRT